MSSSEWGVSWGSYWGITPRVIIIGDPDKYTGVLPIYASFSTPQECHDSFGGTLDYAYIVIYTDGEPYYPTNDPFWNPYNQDAVYEFSVRKQNNYLVSGEHTVNLDLSLGLY